MPTTTLRVAIVCLVVAVAGCGDNIHPGSGSLPNPASSDKDITRFTIQGVDGAIAGTDIALTLPFGTDVTNLAPEIEITGVSVSPGSSVTEDFTGPVAYTVTAEDG